MYEVRTSTHCIVQLTACKSGNMLNLVVRREEKLYLGPPLGRNFPKDIINTVSRDYPLLCL